MHNRTILLQLLSNNQSVASGSPTDEELLCCRDEVRRLWEQNQCDYTARYGNSPANYAASLNDDFNGDGDDFTRLTLLLYNINAELRRRRLTVL